MQSTRVHAFATLQIAPPVHGMLGGGAGGGDGDGGTLGESQNGQSAHHAAVPGKVQRAVSGVSSWLKHLSRGQGGGDGGGGVAGGGVGGGEGGGGEGGGAGGGDGGGGDGGGGDGGGIGDGGRDGGGMGGGGEGC